MDEARRQELKALIRTSPGVESTFAVVDADYRAKHAHLATIKAKHDELSAKLTAIATARAILDEPAPKTGEPAPTSSPAAKPIKKESKP